MGRLELPSSDGGGSLGSVHEGLRSTHRADAHRTCSEGPRMLSEPNSDTSLAERDPSHGASFLGHVKLLQGLMLHCRECHLG